MNNKLHMDSSSERSSEDGIIKADVGFDQTISALNSLTQFLSEPQNYLHTLLIPPSGDDDASETHKQQIELLCSTSKILFSRLEKLACMAEQVENMQKGISDEEEDECPLSGLTELYTGIADDDEDNGPMELDAESVWGQVDIQNTALTSKVSKNIRKLSKKVESNKNQDDCIRLLNMHDIDSDDDSDLDQANKRDADSSKEEIEEEESDNQGSDDEDARRIRERMERSMAEMDDDDVVSDSDESIQNDAKSNGKAVDEDDVDPAREELNDGFFDLHEMENFADEEEDMLPNEAYGEPEPEENEVLKERKKKNLPHLRGRAGKDGEDDEDEGFDDLERNVERVTRKKYREDDDIDALASMYVEEEEEPDSDDEIVNMSASDFFGKPRKASKEYTKKLQKEKEKKKVSFQNDDPESTDSWDNHDFEKEGADWREKSNNDDSSKEGSQEGGSDDEGNDSDSDNGDEEQEGGNSNPDDTQTLSSFGQRSEKQAVQIKELEKDMLAEKPWQMLGETSAKKRPENSLLESTPEFEFATKQAPIITQEHTESIEEMIKKRILAEDWDDVVPRELPDIGMNKRNGELPEVSQEKSKLSLGELYEREYLKKAVGYDKDAEEKETEEDKAKNEMKMLFANLCSKLDALSNYHFAPRPVADEAQVKTAATPAIAMEEVLPLHVSNATAMAPEEIFNKKKGRDGILRSESEMTQEDRKRLRQSKKAARRKSRKAKLADEKLISRLKPELGLNNPYEKRKMREELQMARASGKVVEGKVEGNDDFKTSAKFFQKLQAGVQQQLHEDGDVKDKKRKLYGEETKKSSRFKL